MTRIRCLLVLLMLLLPCHHLQASDAIPAQFSVIPSLFELEVGDAPVNDHLTVTNLKKRPVTMRVELYAWTLDERHEIKLVPSSSSTLDQWMVVNPLRFTMQPGAQQAVRFSVRPRLKPAPGEYRAILYLIEEPDPTVQATGKMQLSARFGVGIYGIVPPVVHAPRLLDLSYDRPTSSISLHLRNDGNVHTRFRGRYTVWKKGSFPGFSASKKLPDMFEPGKEPPGYLTSGVFPGDPVLAGTDRHYVLKVAVPKNCGPYVVAVVGELGEKQVEKLFL